MEQIFKNRKLNVSVRTVRCGEGILFYAKDVAESLGYSNTRKAIRDHVWEEDKCTAGGLKRRNPEFPLLGGQPGTVLITEQGLYQLIFGSELSIAKEFRVWVFKDVLPSIRKTGSYSLPDRRSLRHNQMILINETDLHYAVVGYIRDNHPEAVIVPGLGEYQDTSAKRCDAWKKGYKGGQPDLIIENPMGKYKGFAIELKTPKGIGVTSESQINWLIGLRQLGYMTMISDDLVQIGIRINEYFSIKRKVKKIVASQKIYKLGPSAKY